MIAMEYSPPSTLTETWIYLACSTRPEYEPARVIAVNNITKLFGNIENAEMYLKSFEHKKTPY